MLSLNRAAAPGPEDPEPTVAGNGVWAEILDIETEEIAVWICT
jgi:hypothetical protein